MHLILKSSVRPQVTAWLDTRVMGGALMEHTPLSCALLQLHSVVLCLWPWGSSSPIPPYLFPLFCNLGAPFPCFRFADPKSCFFYLNLCSILIVYQYAFLTEEMSRNSVPSSMYLCRKPQYLSTKIFSKSLIPNFMQRV